MTRVLMVVSLVWTVACASTGSFKAPKAEQVAADRMSRCVEARAAIVSPLLAPTTTAAR